jgi:hypothetical protein
MGRFWQFIRDINPDPGRLPLIHNTDLYCFREIRATDQLSPMDCNVYEGEKLLYFFYGRPSYRLNANHDTVTAKALLPVCLIMSRSILTDAARMLALDSGAFHKKMMHPPMHEKMVKDDFELGVSADAPMRLIKMFYLSEEDYYMTRPKVRIDPYNEYDDFEVDSYFRLLHHRSNTPYDDRVTAIEIQTSTPVDLPGKIDAAILPKPFLDQPGIVTQIESWGGVAIPYNVKAEFIPREIQGAIFEKLTDFLRLRGLNV